MKYEYKQYIKHNTHKCLKIRIKWFFQNEDQWEHKNVFYMEKGKIGFHLLKENNKKFTILSFFLYIVGLSIKKFVFNIFYISVLVYFTLHFISFYQIRDTIKLQ